MQKKGRNEKAQLYSQLFTYIITIIVVSIILVFGYRSIKALITRSDDVACLKFQGDLKNSIDGMLNDFGSVKTKEFSSCPKGKKVCFVETFKKVTNIPANTDPIIRDSIIDGTGENVFIIEDITKESFYAGNISVVSPDGSDIMCMQTSGEKLRLKMESKGSHVALSRG